MKCPKCSFQQPDNSNECVSCRIVFAKFLSKQKQVPENPAAASFPSPASTEEEMPTNISVSLKELLFNVDSEAVAQTPRL